jgi:hypothetical protein
MPCLILVGARVAESYRTGQAIAGGISFADSWLQWGSAAGLAPSGAGYSLAEGNGQNCISIQLNNRSGICASMSVKELWRVSKKNGYTGSFQEWSTCGAPAMLTPADLGLSLDQGDLPVGLSGNVNLSVTGNFNNSNYINNMNQLRLADWTGPATATPIELVVVVVFKGVAYITPDSMNLSTSYLTSNEVNQALRSSGEGYIPSSAVQDAGGRLFDGQTNVLHSTAGPRGRKKGGAVSNA